MGDVDSAWQLNLVTSLPIVQLLRVRMQATVIVTGA